MRFLAAILVTTLAGCSTTSLEMLPTGASEQCPAELKGGFVGLAEGDDTAVGVFVDDDCKVEVFDRDKDPKAAPVTVKTAWFERYVLFDRREAEVAAKAPERQALTDAHRWFLFGWSRDGDQLRVRHADHQRIATLIVNQAINGETRWHGDDGHNLLLGPPDDLAAVLKRFDLLGDTAPAEFRFVGRDRKAFERAIAKGKR